MTEIMITEPSILPVIKYIILDIGIILLTAALLFFRLFRMNYWRSLMKMRTIEISNNIKKIILVGVVLFVLVFDSNTMKFIFDISFENINMYQIESKVYSYKNNKYSIFSGNNFIVFEVNDIQKYNIDTYFKDKECIIEYYRQSQRIKKITLNQ